MRMKTSIIFPSQITGRLHNFPAEVFWPQCEVLIILETAIQYWSLPTKELKRYKLTKIRSIDPFHYSCLFSSFAAKQVWAGLNCNYSIDFSTLEISPRTSLFEFDFQYWKRSLNWKRKKKPERASRLSSYAVENLKTKYWKHSQPCCLLLNRKEAAKNEATWDVRGKKKV